MEWERIQSGARAIRERTSAEPRLGIVLGTGLAALADEVDTWPWVLGAGLAVVSGLIVAVMLVGCLALSRRWAADIAAIAAFAQGVATGVRVPRPSSLHASEFVELDDAVHQLYRMFVAVLRKTRNP